MLCMVVSRFVLAQVRAWAFSLLFPNPFSALDFGPCLTLMWEKPLPVPLLCLGQSQLNPHAAQFGFQSDDALTDEVGRVCLCSHHAERIKLGKWKSQGGSGGVSVAFTS
jgi:hypothetical protein